LTFHARLLGARWSMRSARQINPNGGSVADFTVDCHGPAGLLGKPVNQAEAEASALVHFLGREEGLKGATADLLAHAGSGVGDRDHYVIAGIQGGKTAAISANDVSGRDCQFSPSQHRVSRI